MAVQKPANVLATTISPHSIFLTWDNTGQYDSIDIQRKATIQTLDLLVAGYTDCVDSDIGKQIQDDTAEIGVLVAYNNTTREWVISTALTVIDGSAMTITGGTGAGEADGNSTPATWGLLTVLDDGTKQEYLDDNLGEGLYIATEYCYKIRGCISIGESEECSDWTTEECATTFIGLQAPTLLIATAITDTIVDLIFTMNSSDEDNVCIERRPVEEPPAEWVELSPLLAKRRDSFRDTGLTKGVAYDYRVRVKITDPLEYSGYSNTAEITTINNPSAPTVLTISEKEDKKLRLSWTDNSDDETGFKVEISDDGNFAGEEIIKVIGADITTFLVTGLDPSTQYWFRVCAYNAAGDSTYSNTATDTMLPAYIPTPFEKWIRNPNIEAVILCEINPGKELSGFTLTATKTYTYELVITDRAIVTFEKVYEYTTAGVVVEYTEKSSINEVEANASSYWFDSVTRKIYVHTSNGTNPSNFFIEGRFWLYITNAQDGTITFNGNYYYGFLALENIPSMSQEIKPLFTGSFSLSSGTISFKNTEHTVQKFFDTRFADYLWRDAKIILKIGMKGFPYDDYEEVFTSLIDKVSCNDSLLNLDLKDLRANLIGRIPVNKYSVVDFPHMDDAQEGKVIPIVFRRRADIVPVCIHRDYKRWKFHDGPDYPIIAVHKVTVNGVEKVAGTDYYVDYQRGVITFDDSVEIDWEKDIIEVDFTGVADSAQAQIENGAEIFKFIMNEIMGVPNSELDLDSIYETKYAESAEAGPKLSYAIVKEENLGDVIHRIENSTKSWSFQDEEGRIGLQVAQTALPSNVVYVENFHIAEGGHSQEKGTDYVFKEINVYYSESIMEGKKKWEIYTKPLPAFVNKYGKRKPLESLDVYTFFINVPPAEALANDIASILVELEGGFIHETLPWVLYGCRVGDLIKLSRGRFYSSSGAASEITVRLLKLDKGISSGKSTIMGVTVS